MEEIERKEQQKGTQKLILSVGECCSSSDGKAVRVFCLYITQLINYSLIT